MHKYIPSTDEYYCDGCGEQIYYPSPNWHKNLKERKLSWVHKLKQGRRCGKTIVLTVEQPYCESEFEADFCQACAKKIAAYIKSIVNK